MFILEPEHYLAAPLQNGRPIGHKAAQQRSDHNTGADHKKDNVLRFGGFTWIWSGWHLIGGDAKKEQPITQTEKCPQDSAGDKRVLARHALRQDHRITP